MSVGKLENFIAHHSGIYPYSDVRQSMRGGYETEWLILAEESTCTDEEAEGGLFYDHFIVKTSTMPHEIVEELIVTKSGIPLPPDCCEVMNYLYSFGADYHQHWMREVAAMFWKWFTPLLVFHPYERDECFYLTISELMRLRFGDTRYYCQIERELESAFLIEYVGDPNNGFSGLIHFSNDYFERRMEELNARREPLYHENLLGA